jgi:hypothetical protein
LTLCLRHVHCTAPICRAPSTLFAPQHPVTFCAPSMCEAPARRVDSALFAPQLLAPLASIMCFAPTRRADSARSLSSCPGRFLPERSLPSLAKLLFLNVQGPPCRCSSNPLSVWQGKAAKPSAPTPHMVPPRNSGNAHAHAPQLRTSCLYHSRCTYPSSPQRRMHIPLLVPFVPTTCSAPTSQSDSTSVAPSLLAALPILLETRYSSWKH